MEENQQTIISQPMEGQESRKLRKVKRPIRRIMPGSPLAPQQQINMDENLDDLLDNQLNLPVVNSGARTSNQTAKNMQSEQQGQKYRPNPRFINDADLPAEPRFIDQLMVGNLFTLKGVLAIIGVVFLLTMLIGKFVLGGKTIVKDGLQGVVVNVEVPKGRARCGVAERTQGCVLYIMNPQSQDLQGRDYYDLASQLTGRQRFVVETGNMRYSSVKIRPGELAQINIPPLQ